MNDDHRQVGITAPVVIAVVVLLVGIWLLHFLGVIPQPLAAASASALAIVLVLFAISVVELVDSRLEVGWTSNRLPAWWGHPSVPIAALGVGVVIGYFFW